MISLRIQQKYANICLFWIHICPNISSAANCTYTQRSKRIYLVHTCVHPPNYLLFVYALMPNFTFNFAKLYLQVLLHTWKALSHVASAAFIRVCLCICVQRSEETKWGHRHGMGPHGGGPRRQLCLYCVDPGPAESKSFARACVFVCTRMCMCVCMRVCDVLALKRNI